MTESSASSIRILRLTPKDAETILFARALESTSRDAWPQEKLRALSLDARSVAGDQATPEDFLLTRAKLLIARAKDEDAGIALPRLPSAPTMALKGTASIVIFLGFFTGAVADQLASSGATLNLLAPVPRHPALERSRHADCAHLFLQSRQHGFGTFLRCSQELLSASPVQNPDEALCKRIFEMLDDA